MPFAPTDVTGCKLWLKSDTGVYKDAGVTPAANGDTVQQWNDQSGNANNATQGTAGNRPTFRTAQINSLPDINFTGSHPDWLGLPDLGLSAAGAGEIFIVVKDNNDPPGVQGNTGMWTFSSNASNNNSHFPWTDGIIYESWGTNARYTTVNPTPALTSYRIYNVRAASGSWVNALDGKVLFSVSSNTVSFLTTGIRLGHSNLGGGAYGHDGPFVEVIVYDNVISTANRDSVLTYLNDRYALGLTIPVPRQTTRITSVAVFEGSKVRVTRNAAVAVFTGSKVRTTRITAAVVLEGNVRARVTRQTAVVVYERVLKNRVTAMNLTAVFAGATVRVSQLCLVVVFKPRVVGLTVLCQPFFMN